MIEHFKGRFYFLSNFSHSKIKINGCIFDNAEAAFHSFKDESRKEEFIGLNPSLAKKLGRSVKLREDWEEIKDHIMYLVVLAKFEQNPHLQKKLLSTGNRKLVEGNNWGDKYWGVCKGEGKNRLGQILELVRAHLDNQKRLKKIIEEQEEDPIFTELMETLTTPDTGD